MRSQFARPWVGALSGLALCGLLIVSPATAAQPKSDSDESQIFGEWKGESIVVAKGSAAKDEVVVWHISPTKEPGKARVKADKIVNGRTITMGVSDWDYDKSKQTITWKVRLGVWQLRLDGKTLKGTLTLNDQSVFRRVSLEKSVPPRTP
jgi:hypothetical protein